MELVQTLELFENKHYFGVIHKCWRRRTKWRIKIKI